MIKQHSKIEVINRDGWHKEYPLQKSIIHIGSASSNDIILEDPGDSGIAPLHAQLIASGNDNGAYKLVNLANIDIPLGSKGDQVLATRAVLDLVDGETFRLGDFTLIFHGQEAGRGNVATTRRGNGKNIGLSLLIPQTQLVPNRSLEGVIVVSNYGEQGSKFDLELEGLDSAYYDMSPGPLLSPGAKKEVALRIHHRGSKPLAGEWQLTIRATAPKAYPGQQASVSQVIQILPFYQHKLRLIDSDDIQSLSSTNEAVPIQPADDNLQRPIETDLPPKAGDTWNVEPAIESSPPDAPLKLRASAPIQPQSTATTNSVEATPPSQTQDLWDAPVEVAPPLQTQTSLSPQAQDLWEAYNDQSGSDDAVGEAEEKKPEPQPISDVETPPLVTETDNESQSEIAQTGIEPGTSAQVKENPIVETQPEATAVVEEQTEAQPEVTAIEEEQTEDQPVFNNNEIEADDWQEAEAKIIPSEQEPEILKIEANPQAAPEKEAPLEVQTGADSWWTVSTAEVDTVPQTKEQQPLKLKATPPSRAKRKQTSEVEDLWTAD